MIWPKKCSIFRKEIVIAISVSRNIFTFLTFSYCLKLQTLMDSLTGGGVRFFIKHFLTWAFRLLNNTIFNFVLGDFVWIFFIKTWDIWQTPIMILSSFESLVIQTKTRLIWFFQQFNFYSLLFSRVSNCVGARKHLTVPFQNSKELFLPI